jgi:hypothetical protein
VQRGIEFDFYDVTRLGRSQADYIAAGGAYAATQLNGWRIPGAVLSPMQRIHSDGKDSTSVSSSPKSQVLRANPTYVSVLYSAEWFPRTFLGWYNMKDSSSDLQLIVVLC